MLSSNELSNLYKIISDEDQTFENISHTFSESFKESDYMRIAMSLCILIKDNLFNKTQRIISFYILYLLQKKLNYEISPFTPLILETIQKTNFKRTIIPKRIITRTFIICKCCTINTNTRKVISIQVLNFMTI